MGLFAAAYSNYLIRQPVGNIAVSKQHVLFFTNMGCDIVGHMHDKANIHLVFKMKIQARLVILFREHVSGIRRFSFLPVLAQILQHRQRVNCP